MKIASIDRTQRQAVVVLVASLGVATAALAEGEFLVVDTVQDVVDFAGAQRVGDLPGPDGRVSFREAVTAANNTTGPQTIEFAVPQSEWWLVEEYALLHCDCGPFIVTDDALTVNGHSQTEFTGDTNPFGLEIGFWGDEPNCMGGALILVRADDCVFTGIGLVHRKGYAIELDATAQRNRVVGNMIDGPLYAAVLITGSDNVIGGTNPGEGNTLSSGNDGVRLQSAWQSPPPANNRIVGNDLLTGIFAGVRVRDGATGTVIGGPTPAERNVIAGAGNRSYEGFPQGEQVAIEEAAGTLVEGNYIGTNAAGNAAAADQRGPAGVYVRDSDDTIVRGNLISGIRVNGTNHYAGRVFGDAVLVVGESDNTLVVGNRMGTDAGGLNPVPNLFGVRADTWYGGTAPTSLVVGGPNAEDANLIAFNEFAGVGILTIGVTITRNSIHSNGDLGIDLYGFGWGVTLNDVGDPDSGGNNLQNFPIVESAVTDGSRVSVEGFIETSANDSFVLEFFANDVCNDSGLGEGERFLGATTVTTGEDGVATFSAELAATGVASGEFVTATATRVETGDTSEFSLCEEVTGGNVGVSLTIVGDCPGAMTLQVDGATPGERVAFLYARGMGGVAIPPGNLCAGTPLGLDSSATLLGTARADGAGRATLDGKAPPAACGRVVVQAIDLASCSTSNVEGL